MTSDIEMPLVGGGRLNGALARPTMDGRRPGVIVIHEVFGDQPDDTEASHPIGRLVFLPMRLGYAPAPAADGWRRVFAFLDRHLNPNLIAPSLQ